MDNAICPKKQRDWDACFDLYSAESLTIAPGKTAIILTWIGHELPEGFFGKIYWRSWLAKSGIISIGGVIDENYRGVIGVWLLNTSDLPYEVKAWDKIWCFGEKKPYKVIWRNKRYLIMAKPFFAIKNFVYSIIDLQQGRMWPDNSLFGWYDYLKREDAESAIKDLESWDLEISERRGCRLVVPDRIQKQRR